MSGLTDLSGIALRAYTPGATATKHAAGTTETADAKKSAQSAFTDRRLAPAFSIELSLAAQKALGGVSEQVPSTEKSAALSPSVNASGSYEKFSEGVGRREVPLASEQRNIAPGSLLNIQI